MPTEKEKIVSLVTELVSQRLEEKKSRSQPQAKTLLLLLPEPFAGLGVVAAQSMALRELGWRVRVLAGQQVLRQADVEVVRGRLGDEMTEMESALLGQWLESVEQTAAVWLAGLGFSAARRLCQLDDGEAAARLSLRALLLGVPVLAGQDGLFALPAAREGEAVREGRRLLVGLERLGIKCVPLARLAEESEKRTSAGPARLADLDGLLSESAVEAAFRAGMAKLLLPAGTLITPLARTRAAELGIELVFEEK